MHGKSSMSRWPQAIVGLFGVVGAFALAAGPAEAVTVGPCTVKALKPHRASETGARIYASVRCQPAGPPAHYHALMLEMQLWGDDPARDDKLGQHTRFINVPPTEVAKTVRNDRCNEDWGRDELYAKVRARRQIIVDGVRTWTPWSAWDTGPKVTFNCR